jgi:hypothetical protein
MKMLFRKDEIQYSLERLDQLTKDEGLSAAAQTLGVVHVIADDMRVVMEGAQIFSCLLANICLNTCFIRWEDPGGSYRTEFRYVSREKQVSP